MNVYELTERVGGEILRGMARVRRDNEYIIIGRQDGDDMLLTEAGKQMVRELEPPPKPLKPEAPKPVARASRKKATPGTSDEDLFTLNVDELIS